jgi:ADP-ribosyl-[dinitrogen reductase] hydrolase
MLGGIAGDIIGSVYEKRNHKRKDFAPLFHPKARFTDDTVCIVAVADALLHGRHPVQALQDWGRRYEHTGGWGQRFAFWLVDDDPRPYNSWGNGGAMRVAPVALLAGSLDEVLILSESVTIITHNHPEGLRGAQATAAAIWLALQGTAAEVIRAQVSERFGYDLNTTVDAIRPGYRHTEAAQYSVPQALVCALEAVSYEDAVRNAISIGGDSDTIAAIAGAVAEARFGLSPDLAAQAWAFLDRDMRAVLTVLYDRFGSGL